jgi:hypothetical protein
VEDDAQATHIGFWIASTVRGGQRVGDGYVHDGNNHKGDSQITFTPDLPAKGLYEIRVLFPPNPNRATRVPVTVKIAESEPRPFLIDQRSEASHGDVPLGRFQLPAGRATSVTVVNRGTDGFVVADGVQFLPVK